MTGCTKAYHKIKVCQDMTKSTVRIIGQGFVKKMTGHEIDSLPVFMTNSTIPVIGQILKSSESLYGTLAQRFLIFSKAGDDPV